jgi:L-threonylcarbamoyladenylate synthase
MAELLDWQLQSGRRVVLECAVQALQRGELVVFPTDTSYCVAANVLAPEAVEKVLAYSSADDPPILALPSAEHALDWAPRISSLGRRLARRCWPGPVTLVFPGMAEELTSPLPEGVRQKLCPAGSVSLTVPGHDAIVETMLNLSAPLVLVRLAQPPGTHEMTVEQLGNNVGVAAAVIVADGTRPTAPPDSIVQVNGQNWTMVREGAVTAAEVARKTTCVILFVCTGNTCRSPMAEALCNKLLADRLRCSPEELIDRGYLVLSAGLAAYSGDEASPEAVQAVQELGGDLAAHASKPLTPDLVLAADHLLAMTQGHLAAVAARFGHHGPRPRLLDPAGGDVADPVGADQQVYRDCARQIAQHLERFLPELQLP